MAWIESHTVLIRHRKTLLLSVALGVKPVVVVGHLTTLWHAVLEQQEDGDLSAWPDVMIAHAAAFEGDAALFVRALEATKWIDERTGSEQEANVSHGKVIHDWIEYAGRFLIKKYSTSNRSRLCEIWKLHGYKYGKRDAKSLHRLANRKRTHSEQKANLPNLTKPLSSLSSLSPKTEKVQKAQKEERSGFADANRCAGFQEFWRVYPARSGRKVEKAKTEALFFKLSPQDQILTVQAARHYAETLKRDGLNAKDPKRFLLDGKGHEPWRDWIEPAAGSESLEVRMQRWAQQEGTA